MKLTPRRYFHLLGALIVALAGLSLADTAAAQAADPPGRVARLADLNGQVWLYSPDRDEWVSAVRNQPLTSGDRLATDPGARAELQVGSTTLRLDSSTELEVRELDDDRLSLQLHNGSLAARVRDPNAAGQFELATDEGRFVIQSAGSYRFDRVERASRATVHSGLARYEGPNSGLPITAGQNAEFWIDAAGAAQYSLNAPANDAFAAWNNARDRPVAAASPSLRYVSPEMTGAEELDRYGRWEQSPDYGALWVPTVVVAGWAPYSHGHWAWVRPWGWTWIDDAPWGFAPFHYGRWVNVRERWCWTPGQRVVRPVYAPALVAWVGGPRANVSISIGGGAPAVGWFPLAPREVYVPSYRSSPRYVQNINITHVTNVTQITNVINNPQAPREFENRRHPQAITVVPAAVMTERRPVAPAAAQFRQAPSVRELTTEPSRGVAMLAPPVAAPMPPPRNVDQRGVVRPPPGGGERPAFARPGVPPHERDGADRPGAPRAAERPDPAVVQRPAAPVANAAPPVAAAPPSAAGPTMRVLPIRPAPIHPDLENAERRGEPQQPGAVSRRPTQREGAVERPPAVAQPPLPAAPAQPVVAAPVQEAPTMRPLPVRRNDERREERVVPPRPQPQAQPQPVANGEVRAPQRAQAPPAPVAARPAEAQRVAPPPPAEQARPRPEPPHRAEHPGKELVDQKRGDGRDGRDVR